MCIPLIDESWAAAIDEAIDNNVPITIETATTEQTPPLATKTFLSAHAEKLRLRLGTATSGHVGERRFSAA
jgi:hypothetical protein